MRLVGLICDSTIRVYHSNILRMIQLRPHRKNVQKATILARCLPQIFSCVCCKVTEGFVQNSLIVIRFCHKSIRVEESYQRCITSNFIKIHSATVELLEADRQATVRHGKPNRFISITFRYRRAVEFIRVGQSAS